MTPSPHESLWQRARRLLIGPPRDPLARETRQAMSLAAFLAWVGLGADGLSSANYGPEEAFLALSGHTHLALYLALATAVTVFVIALAYNHVIELFPSGGGGYKVASELIGPRAGLLSGSALMVDYVLTIAISVASGVDALFSLLPLHWQVSKLAVSILMTVALVVLNLRGVKEPLGLLLPVFLGFFLSHAALIVYGVAAHAERLSTLVPGTLVESGDMIDQVGWVAFAAVLLRAFALGGGTYTGIEAVSNNVQMLKEPRVPTGRRTMLYMAVSLSFTAAGLLILYLLWDVEPRKGMTLNAVAFDQVLGSLFGDGSLARPVLLLGTLVFAAGILFVAANTGFLGGPAVLSNMAHDGWVPVQFSYLSSRLVTQNGVLLMGIAAIVALFITGGRVHLLVVLYSINVFLTFSLSLYGLTIYWWRQVGTRAGAVGRLTLALLGLVISVGILAGTLVAKFTHGAWMTVLITGFVVGVCLLIARHYAEVAALLKEADDVFANLPADRVEAGVVPLDPTAPTAVFLVGRSLGTGMHTLLTALRLFPKQFRNFIFLTACEVEAGSYREEEKLDELQAKVQAHLERYVVFCTSRGLAATSMCQFGSDAAEQLTELCERTIEGFPRCVFFAAKLVFKRENAANRLLHNQTAFALQRRLHLRGQTLVILPIKL